MSEIEYKSRLYKYCSINKNSIEALTLEKNWISDPLFFNDPFEFTMPSDTRYCGETQKILMLSERELENRNIMKALTDQFGIICYSYRNDNILMWSHYANNHTGMCLAFEPILPYNNPRVGMAFGHLNKVKYDKIVPSTNFANFEIKDIIDLFCTKSEDWAYEEEVRQIFDVKSQYVEYPGVLKEIIFGCRTTESDINLITKLLSGKNIEFHFCEKQDGQYSLMIGSGMYYDTKYAFESSKTQNA